jgi:hypothetical protein
LDNATNNNTAVHALVTQYGFNSNERKIRCALHFIHLTVIIMLYGAGSQKVQLDELLAAYGDRNFPQNEFDENNDNDNDNYYQLNKALRELADDNDFTSDSEDFFQKTRMSRLANFLLLQRPFRP